MSLDQFTTKLLNVKAEEIQVCVNIFSGDPYKIVLQSHYMRKMELTFPMAVRLSVYAPIPPFLIPYMWNHGRFLQRAPQDFSQLRALRGFYGLELAE